MAARWLGIDYGARRVGLARGYDDPKIAQPWQTLPNNEQLLAKLKEIIHQEGIEQLVIGLPRGLDGQETAQTALTRQFAASLEPLGMPVALQDEAATSSAHAGADNVDAAAAAMILQDYLDDHPA